MNVNEWMALARENFTQMQTNGKYEKEMFQNVKWYEDSRHVLYASDALTE